MITEGIGCCDNRVQRCVPQYLIITVTREWHQVHSTPQCVQSTVHSAFPKGLRATVMCGTNKSAARTEHGSKSYLDSRFWHLCPLELKGVPVAVVSVGET